MTEVVHDARLFAIAAHDAVGQKRKYTGEAYWMHPMAVAEIVASVSPSQEMIAAAWLHDVVEDTGVSAETIEVLFGPLVAKYVEELTKVEVQGNRAVRKHAEFLRLSGISNAGKTIKLADLIHNTGSICEHDPAFAAVYMAEKRRLLDALTGGDEELHVRASTLVKDYYDAQGLKR